MRGKTFFNALPSMLGTDPRGVRLGIYISGKREQKEKRKAKGVNHYI